MFELNDPGLLYRRLLVLHSENNAKIALRRTEGLVEGCIGFHCDAGDATKTVQLALNGDHEYDGRRLCFITKGLEVAGPDLSIPSRLAGTLAYTIAVSSTGCRD